MVCQMKLTRYGYVLSSGMQTLRLHNVGYSTRTGPLPTRRPQPIESIPRMHESQLQNCVINVSKKKITYTISARQAPNIIVISRRLLDLSAPTKIFGSRSQIVDRRSKRYVNTFKVYVYNVSLYFAYVDQYVVDVGLLHVLLM